MEHDDLMKLSIKELTNLWGETAKKYNNAISQERVPHVDITRNLFALAALISSKYNDKGNWLSGLDGRPVEFFPTTVAAFFTRLFMDILSGRIPDPIYDLVRSGTAPVGWRESKDITIAAMYVKAAREEIISDDAPIKTVAEKYGVARETVSRWLKKHGDFEFSDLWTGLEGQDLAKKISTDFEKAAAGYKKHGRGATAVATRPKKTNKDKRKIPKKT